MFIKVNKNRFKKRNPNRFAKIIGKKKGVVRKIFYLFILISLYLYLFIYKERYNKYYLERI